MATLMHLIARQIFVIEYSVPSKVGYAPTIDADVPLGIAQLKGVGGRLRCCYGNTGPLCWPT